jgi:hypothetical protein
MGIAAMYTTRRGRTRCRMDLVINAMFSAFAQEEAGESNVSGEFYLTSN